MSSICNCIKDSNFDFVIDLKQDYLVFTDYSDWLINSKITKPFDEFDLKISNYQTDDFKIFKVKPNLSSIIKYSELPIESKTSCPPDGIYKFSINVCQGTQEFCKVQAILANSQLIYENLVKEESWDNAYEVLKYLEYIRVFANNDNIKKVMEYYEILQKFIKKLKCNCNEWSLSMFKPCSNI
jgi:hypothetical protein